MRPPTPICATATWASTTPNTRWPRGRKPITICGSRRGSILNQVFCLEEERIVSPDWVVQYGQRWLQIERDGQKVRVPRGATVLVREHRDGSLSLWLNRAKLRWHEIPERPRKPAPLPKQHVAVQRPPAPEHPWRQPFTGMRPREWRGASA